MIEACIALLVIIGIILMINILNRRKTCSICHRSLGSNSVELRLSEHVLEICEECGNELEKMQEEQWPN